MTIDDTLTRLDQKALTYSTVTHSIEVSATPEFLGNEVNNDKEYYIWSYHIHIKNLSGKKVQLLNRHWVIIDGNGQVQEVKGPGVVGDQPTIAPNEFYEYSSGTFLITPTGMMMGQYEMATEDGDLIEVSIPAFSLDSPDANPLVN